MLYGRRALHQCPLALRSLRASLQPRLTLSSKCEPYVKDCPERRNPIQPELELPGQPEHSMELPLRCTSGSCPLASLLKLGSKRARELSLLCLFYALKMHQLPIQFPSLPFSLVKQDRQALQGLSEESSLFKIPAARIKEIMPEEALCKL